MRYPEPWFPRFNHVQTLLAKCHRGSDRSKSTGYLESRIKEACCPDHPIQNQRQTSRKYTSCFCGCARHLCSGADNLLCMSSSADPIPKAFRTPGLTLFEQCEAGPLWPRGNCIHYPYPSQPACAPGSFSCKCSILSLIFFCSLDSP